MDRMSSTEEPPGKLQREKKERRLLNLVGILHGRFQISLDSLWCVIHSCLSDDNTLIDYMYIYDTLKVAFFEGMPTKVPYGFSALFLYLLIDLINCCYDVSGCNLEPSFRSIFFTFEKDEKFSKSAVNVLEQKAVHTLHSFRQTPKEWEKSRICFLVFLTETLHELVGFPLVTKWLRWLTKPGRPAIDVPEANGCAFDCCVVYEDPCRRCFIEARKVGKDLERAEKILTSWFVSQEYLFRSEQVRLHDDLLDEDELQYVSDRTTMIESSRALFRDSESRVRGVSRKFDNHAAFNAMTRQLLPLGALQKYDIGFTCKRCLRVHYCSKKCLRSDAKNHSQQCDAEIAILQYGAYRMFLFFFYCKIMQILYERQKIECKNNNQTIFVSV